MKVEKQHMEEPKAEEPKAEEPKAEEPRAEEPKVQQKADQRAGQRSESKVNPKPEAKSETMQEDKSDQNRVALMGIIVEDRSAVSRINGLLYEYGSYIIGRMGIPYRERDMNIISIVLDAPQSVVSALSGKLGMIPGVSSKCLYAKR